MQKSQKKTAGRLFGAGVAALVAAHAARAQEAPAAGEGYRDLRQTLLAKGWKPDVKYGLKTAKGTPLYRFPEIVCGPTLCNAKWRDSGGVEQIVSLLRGDGKEDYRVAP